MTYLLLQTFLLLLSAYFLGAFLACLTKRMVTRRAELAAAAPRASLAPIPVRSDDIAPLTKPRAIDPVQPKDRYPAAARAEGRARAGGARYLAL